MSSQQHLELAPGSGWTEIALPAGTNHVLVQGQSATTAILKRATAAPAADDGNGMWLHSDDTMKLPVSAGDKLYWRPHPSVAAGRGEPARVCVLASVKSVATTSALPAGTDRSGSITAGGTAQQLAAANAARLFLTITNTSAGDLWMNETGGTAAAGAAGSYKIVAGDAVEVTTSSAVSIVGATTGQTWTATEG